MRARLSLRTRVAVNVVAVTALIQLILGMVVFQYFRSTINDFFNHRLTTRLNWAAKEVTEVPGELSTNTLATFSDRTIRLVIYNSLVLVARTPEGKVIATSDPSVELTNLPIPHERNREPDIAMVPMKGIGGLQGDDLFPARTITVPVTRNNGERIFLTAAISDAKPRSM